MKSLLLPGTGRRTSQLGFGCAYLIPENAAVLDAAYEAGIRHFDVARSYGRGLTEGILRNFLRRREADITVTSKYGITPPFSHPLQAAARCVLKPIVTRLRRAPVLDRRINSIDGLKTRKASFRGAEARASLELSLRNLGVQRIDLFLMHEAEPSDLTDPGLLECLLRALDSGEVGAFGVGGKSRHLEALMASAPRFCDVLQYDWTALDPIRMHPASFPVLYRVCGDPIPRIRTALRTDAQMQRKWSDETGHDISRPGMIEQLMLNHALTVRPEAIVLFSSTQPQHVIDDAAAATDARLAAAAARLTSLMQMWMASQRPGA